MSIVYLSNISKDFGKVKAVTDLDITIGEGEFFTFLGPSGCGKTTTLRMIAGFYYPTTGTVKFNERNMTKVAPEKRNTGMVFQNYALFPHMTVHENVAFGLKVRKFKTTEIRNKVKDVLEKVRLDQYSDRQVSQLSGGQQQRVALARALVIEPDILLLDEPLSNLDARLRDDMRVEILRLQREYGITTIYVTHDQVEALTMSDRIAVFNAGVIQQIGTPTQIYNEPVNDFVAEFIGETNLLPVTFNQESTNYITYHSEGMDNSFKVNNSEQNIAPYEASDNLFISIRPEVVQIHREAIDSDNVFKGIVSFVQFTGEAVHTYVKMNDEITIRITDLNTGPSTYLNEGTEVFIHVPTEHIRVVPQARSEK